MLANGLEYDQPPKTQSHTDPTADIRSQLVRSVGRVYWRQTYLSEEPHLLD
jgi:hypothetical protein